MSERRYGQWSGNERGVREDVTRCIKEVSIFHSWNYRQCSRKRGHGPDGLYCKQHAARAMKCAEFHGKDKP